MKRMWRKSRRESCRAMTYNNHRHPSVSGLHIRRISSRRQRGPSLGSHFRDEG